MYVVIRKYASGGQPEEIAHRVGKGLIRVLREQPGFRAYYAFVSEDGQPIAVSVCDSRDAALRANERAQAWVAANMRDIIPDPPEVLMGPMLVDAAAFEEKVDRSRSSQAEPWLDGGV
ncbi:hypothetical protein JMJ55_04280 [Belnapia sp. T6]|uniref:ABM domain-containing protein n=1 Tax=Belnapia mucosa TaxID=2804532 RepID=A0ABS1UYI4_9PROT|nr:hypothetical protein [Belnapia mucosa]MBL6454529.1 hypothetical protein [Belnapia mucosa]